MILAGMIGLRLVPDDAAAQVRPTISKAVLHVPVAPGAAAPKRKVRIIHLYSIPSDQLTPGKA
jgi:hypothetical protein